MYLSSFLSAIHAKWKEKMVEKKKLGSVWEIPNCNRKVMGHISKEWFSTMMVYGDGQMHVTLPSAENSLLVTVKIYFYISVVHLLNLLHFGRDIISHKEIPNV